MSDTQFIQPQPPYPRGGVRVTGRLCVDSDPHGANVYVDGQIVIDPFTEESKKTPFCVDVVEGRRDVVIRLQGHDDLVRYADIFPGRTTNIYGRLKPYTGKEITPLPFPTMQDQSFQYQNQYQPIIPLQSDSSILPTFIASLAGSLIAILIAREWLREK